MAKKDAISPRSVRFAAKFVALFAAVACVDRALGLGISMGLAALATPAPSAGKGAE